MSRDRASATWFGVFLPQLRMDFETIVARTRAAEAAGFDSVWFMDHLAAPAAIEHDTLEGWTVAAAVAARTERIRIGHLVTSDPFRHPTVLAKMAATVDVISHGRLELGIGWGSVEAELAMFGIGVEPARQRAARLRESLEICAHMFTGEPFDYTGAHFTLRGALGRPIPAQRHVPVHIGGAGPRLTMPLVREFADWWNCPSYAVHRLAELAPLAGEAHISVQRPVGLACGVADRAEVTDAARRRFDSWGGLVSGTPGEVAETLALDRAAGADGFVLQFSDFGAPATLARFMAEVAPSVAA